MKIRLVVDQVLYGYSLWVVVAMVVVVVIMVDVLAGHGNCCGKLSCDGDGGCEE